MGQVYRARFDPRPGDGRGPRAYLDRQPAFQTMLRLLVHETGGHFVDLFGDIASVYADLRHLNPAIAGEDASILVLDHKTGARSVFDGNRLSNHATDNSRRAMGEMAIEGEAGCLTLTGDGALTFCAFGNYVAEQIPVTRPIDEGSFGGGCVAALIHHVLDAFEEGRVPENLAKDYLHVMKATESAYILSVGPNRSAHIPRGGDRMFNVCCLRELRAPLRSERPFPFFDEGKRRIR